MKKKKELSPIDIASFCKQMAMILHAGISSYEGIILMCEDVDREKNMAILNTIKANLEQGYSFYESLKITASFPNYFLDLINIGETAGRLEEVLYSLNLHYQRIHDNNEGVKTAICYPLIMIAMMFLVVIVLITQILPIFNQVFEQLGSTITGFSKIVLDLGIIISSYSYAILFSIIFLITLYIFFTRKQKGKERIYELITRFPLTRNISMQLALSKFTSGMAISLSSGLDMERSLIMAKRLVRHPILMKRIDTTLSLIDEHDIATSLVNAKVLTGMHARLIKIGYKTGGLDVILQDIADRYSDDTNERINHLIGIIEPTLVAILSFLVGLILLSVMLPLISVMTSL